MKRFSAFLAALLVSILVIGHAPVIRGGEPTGVSVDDPTFADLRAFMEKVGASADDLLDLAAIVGHPENAEFIKPFGQSGIPNLVAWITPEATVTASLHFDNIDVLSAPGGPLASGEGSLGTVLYGQGLTTPTDTEYYLYAKRFQAPCNERNSVLEYGIVAHDATPLNDGNPDGVDSGPDSNLFYGANVAYVVHSDPGLPYVAQRYERRNPGSTPEFALTDSNWIAACIGSTIVGLIPANEWEGIDALRFFGFELPFDDSGQPIAQDGIQMRLPGVDEDPFAINEEDVIEIDVGEEAAVPTDSPAPTRTPNLTPAPTQTAAAAPPTPAATTGPTAPPITAGGGGLDSLILLALAGLGLIALAVLLWRLSRPDDCDELGRLAKAAQDACDRARKAAAQARAEHDKAAEDLHAAEAYEKAARGNLADAEARLGKTKARAGAAGSDSYVEGEPYGRLTGDDLALQNEANAQARADADAAKADARQAWKDAGSPQGEGAARLDGELSAIEKAAQARMAHNNDPKNIDELRKDAAAKAKAEMAQLEAELAAARQSVDDATAGVRNASETESVARAAADAAQAEADRICNEAAAARKQYDDCVKKKSAGPAAGTNPKPVTPPVGPDNQGLKTPPEKPPPPGTPKSTPPDRPCKDGEEEWRPEGDSRSFTIREDGAKTRVMLWTDPQIKGLTEWIDQSPTKDKRESGEAHPSISSAEVDLISGARLTDWLGGLGSSKGIAAPDMTMHFSIKRKSRTIQCERRWVCRNGGWVAAETRAQITDRPLPPATLNEGPVTPSIQKVNGFLTRARQIINEMKRDEEAAEKAARCE